MITKQRSYLFSRTQVNQQRPSICIDCEDCKGTCWQYHQMMTLPEALLKSTNPNINKTTKSVKL